MIEHVWLLADAASGDVSYIQHGHPDEEESWKTIGPFAFTVRDHAQEAADNPKFLPEGVVASFAVMEVEASGFVQSIYNGFPPTNTDVFTLDAHVYPLTSGGAEWADSALGHPIWGPLFDANGKGEGIDWLNRVLKQVAHHLDMKMETVDAIGAVNAAVDDVATEVEQTALLIQKHVRIAIRPEPGTIAVDGDEEHHTLSPTARFWLHTNGMGHFNLPELEIRDVPPWFVSAAGAELNGWAAFSLDRGISDGDVLDGGGPVPLKIEASASPDLFWKGAERVCLRLEVTLVLFAAGHKKHGPDGPETVH